MQQSLFEDNQPGSVRQPALQQTAVRRRNGHKRGTWDTKYYKEIKAFMDRQMWHLDFRLAEKYKGDPIGWAKSHFHLISDCVHREDFEAAQATKDAIIDFLNKLGAEIPDDAELKIPEYKPMKIR